MAVLPPQLARQIVKFHALCTAVREETGLLRSLPPSLRLQLTAHLHVAMVQAVACFAGCPMPFLLEVCPAVSRLNSDRIPNMAGFPSQTRHGHPHLP